MIERIIDAHCHIYPDGIAARAVAAVDRFYGGLPEDHGDGTVSTLVRTGEKVGISRFVVHSVATKPHQVTSINRFIADAVGTSEGGFIGLGTLHLDSADIERDLAELRALGLKGVKLHPDIQCFDVDEPRAMRVFELCEAAGLPVCVHTGDYRFDHSNPKRVANVLRAFPGLHFIGAHFGGWSVWDEAAAVLSDYANMTVDSSSTFYAVGAEKARELIRIWTPQRIMFGTDYPMWNQQNDIEVLLHIELDEDALNAIFWRNCAQMFDLTFDEEQGEGFHD